MNNERSGGDGQVFEPNLGRQDCNSSGTAESARECIYAAGSSRNPPVRKGILYTYYDPARGHCIYWKETSSGT